MKKVQRDKFYFLPIIIEPLEEGGFFATQPSLQGCPAKGKTYSEVIENIQEVIRVHLEARKAHKEIIPEISFSKKTDLRFTLLLPVNP